jgi:hypothetical protein
MKTNSIELLRRLLLAFVLGTLVGTASASPGAHGPNGEHLDTASSVTADTSTVPRLHAKSELFELVGRLGGGELSILIDRFATNEPVLQADVEVESGQLKAKARFHEDLGDYAVDDPAMLKLLATPGEHPVVITILAGEETDLLDGVLRVGAGQVQEEAAHGHGHGHADQHDGQHEREHDHEGGHGLRWGLVALIALALTALALTWRKRHQGQATTDKIDGDQA